MSKHCSVACDTPQGVRTCELELSDEATIAAALAAARPLLRDSIVDWDCAAVGIYGTVHTREYVPQEGDRIELYRSLKADPRASRRARAVASSVAPRSKAAQGAKRG